MTIVCLLGQLTERLDYLVGLLPPSGYRVPLREEQDAPKDLEGLILDMLNKTAADVVECHSFGR